jgi:hypothetical protein
VVRYLANILTLVLPAVPRQYARRTLNAMPGDDRSAQVILRPTSGSGGRSPRLPPSPASVELARSFFRTRGFQVSPAFGNSFSITGSAAAYRATFGRPSRGPAGGGMDAAELPLDRLPADVADVVQAVVFPPPPDFGPTNF